MAVEKTYDAAALAADIEALVRYAIRCGLVAPADAVWAPDRWYAHTKRTALYQPHWQLVETK